MDLSIDLSCSPPEGQYKRKHRSYSEFTRNEFYDNFSMHFFKIYAEKNMHRSCHSTHNPQRFGDLLTSINETL